MTNRIILVLVCCGIALFAGSCSKRDPLIGKWTAVNALEVMEFREDGTFVSTRRAAGTWEIDGKRLVLTSSGTSHVIDNLRVNSTTLKGNLRGRGVEWHKAD